MTKTISKMLCIVMSISFIITGYQKSSSNQKKEDTQQAQSTNTPAVTGPQNKMPISDGSATLVVASPDNRYSAASLAQNLPVWQEVEKVTGVKIKWEVVPADQYPTIMATRLAAASNLPDILFANFDLYKYGKNGLIIAMDDLLKKYGENAAQVFKENPQLAGLIKTPEGVTYQLSGEGSDAIAAGPYGWLLRKDWLDKLGLKEPTTTEEWYTMLKAFKEKNPTENKEIIPMTNYGGLSNLVIWGNAWGLHLYGSGGFYPDSNGKVQYEWIDGRTKDMVIYLNRLFKEKLLDQEMITNTKDQVISKISRNLTGSIMTWQESTPLYNNKLEETGVKDANWVMTMPPSGSNGYKGHIEGAAALNGAVAITKDCKQPEIAFRWLDYIVYNADNSKRQVLGIEGKSYVMKNGKPELTDFTLKHPDGISSVDAVRSLGAWQYLSMYQKADYVSLLKLTTPEQVERTKKVIPYIVPRLSLPMPTEEENTKSQKKLTDINTYKDEMIIKFIFGQESIDKWDAYTKRVKEMGIDEVLSVKQAQYDRLLKMSK